MTAGPTRARTPTAAQPLALALPVSLPATAIEPERIVISPGPGRLEDAGITMAVVRDLGERTPILDMCLGHQAIGAAFGGHVVRASMPMHGKTSIIEHNGRGVFSGLTAPLYAASPW